MSRRPRALASQPGSKIRTGTRWRCSSPNSRPTGAPRRRRVLTWVGAARSVPSSMARSVVCISHESGAGGEEIGRLIADRLGFLCVDEEVIDRAAKLAGVDPEQVVGEERRKPLFAGLLAHLEEDNSQAVVTPPATPGLPSEGMRAFIRNAIREVAARGKVVIVAHAASYAVDIERHPLRVLVIASRET